MTDRYAVRPMAPDELSIALDWAAAEGWNPGLHDAPCFLAADPQGFLLGLLDGEPAATISVVKYGASFGFLGFYIVKPGLRGRGLGLRIWQAGMASLAGRRVGLDGVPAQQDNYRKSGFSLAWRNIRHEAHGSDAVVKDKRLVPLSGIPFDMLDAYDRRFFPAGRTAFLNCWIRQPGSTALGLMEKGQLAGYAMMRPCRVGQKIGPLFANDAEVAETLMSALRASAGPAEKIYLDTPQDNADAVALARRHGMSEVFETARMYNGPAVPVPHAGVYGITSFELG